MSKFNAMPRLVCPPSPPLVGWRRISLKIALAAIAASAILVGVPHSQTYADSPTAHRSPPPDAAASQALRRYTLQLLHILSDADANQWQRYRRAIERCHAAPTYLAEIGAGSDVAPLDATLAALTADLCADLDLRLHEARTVGLLLNEPESMRGYILLTGNFNNYVHLIDHLGRVAHSWQFENLVTHPKLLDNGNLPAETKAASNRSILEVDPNSNIVWKYTHSDTPHHDFLKMPNDNVLMLMGGLKTREEALSTGADPAIIPSEGTEYDYLIEVRPTGSEGGDIVWEWSTWDYLAQDIDPTKLNYGDISHHPELIDINYFHHARHRRQVDGALDWLHTNAIDYNPDLDQIMLSPRHYSELWIIDHSATAEVAPTRKGGNAGKGGALLYRWGNPRAYGHGTTADQRLFWQHHTQWIDPGLPGAGNILVFNNGYEFAADQRRHYSSIDEIVPPLDKRGYRRAPGKAYPPYEPVWSYTAENPADFYSRVWGGAQRLPNGNTLICESTSGKLFQITPDGKRVWMYVYPMDKNTRLKQGERASLWGSAQDVSSNAVYRAYWYAPDHPGLQKYDLTPSDTIEIYE